MSDLMVQQFATRVARRFEPPGAAGFDPLLVLAVIEIVVAVVKFLRRWKSPQAATAIVHNPGPLARFWLWRQTRFLPEGQRREVYETLISEGYWLVEGDVKRMYAELY